MIRRWCQSRAWYRFSRNRLSVVGLTIVIAVVLMATLAPWIVPYPEHAKAFVDVENMSQPPTVNHLFGTDDVGRDVLSRVVFGYRTSLVLAVVVLAIAAPLGVIFGLIAGYLGGWADAVIMRVTDVFLAVPSLVLAMAILGLFSPSLVMAMVAVSAGWWPWYTRLVYNLSRSLRTEGYVTAAQVVGASSLRIMFSEILPNCLGTVLTKITLDMGFVILLGSSLSFLGLGAQPPTPDLGSMVAEGTIFLPDVWWPSVFPSLAILIVVFGLNLVGDGLRDLFGVEV
jgi:peptide/nickel transport system permease protein